MVDYLSQKLIKINLYMFWWILSGFKTRFSSKNPNPMFFCGSLLLGIWFYWCFAVFFLCEWRC